MNELIRKEKKISLLSSPRFPKLCAYISLMCNREIRATWFLLKGLSIVCFLMGGVNVRTLTLGTTFDAVGWK